MAFRSAGECCRRRGVPEELSRLPGGGLRRAEGRSPRRPATCPALRAAHAVSSSSRLLAVEKGRPGLCRTGHPNQDKGEGSGRDEL